MGLSKSVLVGLLVGMLIAVLGVPLDWHRSRLGMIYFAILFFEALLAFIYLAQNGWPKPARDRAFINPLAPILFVCGVVAAILISQLTLNFAAKLSADLTLSAGQAETLIFALFGAYVGGCAALVTSLRR